MRPHETDVRIAGIFDDRGKDRVSSIVAGYPKLGNIDELVDFARGSRLDLLIVSLPVTAEKRLLQLLKKLWVLPVSPCRRPVRWGAEVPERGQGVYVVVLARIRLIRGQRILYVGRTKRSIRKRVKEFYKHRYGDPRPHHGGQEVLRFKPGLKVHWAATDDPVGAEHLMIERFRDLVGRMPYANRVRASR